MLSHALSSAYNEREKKLLSSLTGSARLSKLLCRNWKGFLQNFRRIASLCSHNHAGCM